MTDTEKISASNKTEAISKAKKIIKQAIIIKIL